GHASAVAPSATPIAMRADLVGAIGPPRSRSRGGRFLRRRWSADVPGYPELEPDRQLAPGAEHAAGRRGAAYRRTALARPGTSPLSPRDRFPRAADPPPSTSPGN